MINATNNIDAIYLLQNALLSEDWDNADQVVNYVITNCKTPLSAEDIIELIKLAEKQMNNGLPFKQYM